MSSPQDFFSARQLAVFGHAFQWLEQCEYPADVRSALALGVSNALATNNKLCSYATDYGRLAPLFSVRSYSLPALAVELNPFHSTAGRGTLKRSIEKVFRSVSPAVRRYVWSESDRKPVPVTLRFRRNGNGADLRCISAERMPLARATADICLFDPPYFDYIAYSELSEFYRAWLDQPRLGGTPLLPKRQEPTTSYADTLSRCLKAALRRLKPRHPLAFTFPSADPDAWVAIGLALDKAALAITALWPVRNDAHMGHHSLDANCEWDLVVVCRRRKECNTARPRTSIERWKKAVAPLKIMKGDQICMELALQMAKPRFGKPRKG
jgi:adenine-specific DNA methylase